MTAPLNFANIASPQIAPQPQSNVGDLPQLILALGQHRAQLAQEAQRLELERQRTEDQLANSTEDRAGAKQRRTQAQAEFEHQSKVLKAHDLVAEALGGVLTQQGDFVQNANAARVRLAQENPDLTPYINDAVDQKLNDVNNAAKLAADARTAKITADVGEATKNARISTANTAANQAKITLTNSRTEAAIHALQLKSFGDEQQQRGLEGFNRLLDIGLNAGQAADMSHTTLPPSIDRSYTRVPKTGNAQAATVADMASMMSLANAAIKNGKAQSLGLAGFNSMTLPTGGLMANTIKYMSVGATSPDEQALANNLLAYTQGLNHLANSARASNQDFDRMLRVVTPLKTEAPEIINQKAVMRDLLPSVFAANARGVPQSIAVNNVIKEARRRGVGASILAPFITLQGQLMREESNPTTPQNRDEQLLNEATGGRPPQ